MGLLNYKIGKGPNQYVACVITTLPTSGSDEVAAAGNALTTWSALFEADTVLPSEGVVVTIPAGAPVLSATLRDSSGNIPADVMVTVTQPDGTILNDPTEPSDPHRVVTILEGSLVNLMVHDPAPGEWRIQVESTNPGQLDYGFFFSTVPSANGPATIDQTLSRMANPGVAKSLATLAGLGSTECFWCKIGCYAIAVILSALAAAGATYITAGALPVAALVSLLGILPATSVALVTGALAALAVSADIAVSYICQWANVCPAADEVRASLAG